MTVVPASRAKIAAFRALHRKGAAFLCPNFWDAGSAKILEGLGFAALASTSSGFALTKARADYGVTRGDVIAHAREVCAAVAIPVTADLEKGFGARPEDCALTIVEAASTGLCGGSIEDSTGDPASPIHAMPAAVDRVAAAAEAARATKNGFVLTARAEAFLYGEADLRDVIKRLQAFEDAGADVLFAPGLPTLNDVAAVCSSVSKPVNVLVFGALAQHSVEEFARAGVARLSVGGGLANAAYAALVACALDIRDTGSFTSLGARRDAVRRVKSIIGD